MGSLKILEPWMHYHLKNIHSHRLVSGGEGLVSGDSREVLASDEEEEKLLKQAIALSLEGAKENDKEEENKNEEDEQEDEEKEYELMLRKAIALSLEGAESS